MKAIFLSLTVVLLTTLFSTFSFCQTDPPYGEVNFIKVKPYMNESYLIDMKTSKKLANSRKANKIINSWQLFRRVYPRGSSMDYDYASFTVFPSAKEMKAEGTWDTGFKELGSKEIGDFLTSLGNTRTTVATDLYHFKMGAGANGKAGDYVQLNLVRVKTGKYDAYLKQLESFKMVIDECIKAGKLKGYNVWDRTYDNHAIEENNLSVTFTFSSFEQALSWASGKTTWSEEFKKVFPKDDYKTFSASFGDLRDVKSQELWELVEVTD